MVWFVVYAGSLFFQVVVVVVTVIFSCFNPRCQSDCIGKDTIGFQSQFDGWCWISQWFFFLHKYNLNGYVFYRFQHIKWLSSSLTDEWNALFICFRTRLVVGCPQKKNHAKQNWNGISLCDYFSLFFAVNHSKVFTQITLLWYWWMLWVPIGEKKREKKQHTTIAQFINSRVIRKYPQRTTMPLDSFRRVYHLKVWCWCCSKSYSFSTNLMCAFIFTKGKKNNKQNLPYVKYSDCLQSNCNAGTMSVLFLCACVRVFLSLSLSIIFCSVQFWSNEWTREINCTHNTI